jgi:copper homeostasis protein
MPRVTRPPKILEVIVTSCEEAVAAEAGGANRLELLRSLEDGGLTPPLNLVRQVVEAVSVPVRVMLRANPSMTVANRSEMRLLESQAEALGHLPIDGMVLGFVDGGSIDLASTGALLARAPRVPVTFHRAFEYCADPLAAIEILKKLPQIDRILATGGAGEWPERRRQQRLFEFWLQRDSRRSSFQRFSRVLILTKCTSDERRASRTRTQALCRRSR